MDGHGDLNDSHAARPIVNVAPDPAYHQRSFAIPVEEDDAEIRQLYRPFILSEPFTADDWVGKLVLSTVLQMVENEIISRKQNRLRILVLYGSMRSRCAKASRKCTISDTDVTKDPTPDFWPLKHHASSSA